MKHSFKHILQRFLGLLEFAIKSLLHYKFIISTKKILFTYITLGLPIFVGFTLLRFNIIPTANQYALSVDIQAGSWDTLTFFSFIAFPLIEDMSADSVFIFFNWNSRCSSLSINKRIIHNTIRNAIKEKNVSVSQLPA